MQWQLKTFKQLSNIEVYKILKLRSDVFVVEQDCVYPDADDIDLHPEVLHLFAEKNNIVAGYLRIIPPDLSFPNKSSLGRVASSSEFRNQGIGHTLIQKALTTINERWKNTICHISAQTYLTRFYEHHGFQIVGEDYLEDGIPHIGMERTFQ